MLVFALGGKATLPPNAPYTPPALNPPPSTASAGEIAAGGAKYEQNCSVCHGVGGNQARTSFPNLTVTPLLYSQAGFDQVVLGGMHVTAMPEEARLHADAVVTGEAEGVWPQVLADFKAGRLQPFYRGEQLPLEGLPTPLYGMLKHGHDFRIVSTARGCPYPCAFCTVNKVFGAKIRMRPIADVVRDVDAMPGKLYINGDENIWWLGKTDRAIELFTALRGSRKKWMGFGSLAPVLAPEGARMLKAARECGMLTVWVGWESMTAEGLKEYRAGQPGRRPPPALAFGDTYPR